MAEPAPRLDAVARSLRAISLAELSQHNTRDDAWISVDGVVYDVSAFLWRRPGDAYTVAAHAGRDITVLLGGFHSARACTFVERLPVVGRLTEAPRSHTNFIAPVADDGRLANFTIYDPARRRVTYAVGRERGVPLEVDRIHEEFREWVGDDSAFPCIAAKMAIKGIGSYGLGVYDAPVGDPENSQALLDDLRTFLLYQSAEWKAGNHLTTFVAVFPNGVPAEWSEFEAKLRAQVIDLSKTDVASPDGVTDQKRNFLMVGLHPAAPRKARRFAYPTLVFNSREQFKYLETTGQMPAIQKAVRRRDKAISGSELVNPILPQISLSIPKGG
jgi:hypothetical protein